MSTPTEQRISEIRERAEKATKAPWRTHNNGGYYVSGIAEAYIPSDRDFIAYAREDVPWLIQHITELRAALQSISKSAHFACERLCAKDYIPRGRHAPDCPVDYYETADEALNAKPANHTEGK